MDDLDNLDDFEENEGEALYIPELYPDEESAIAAAEAAITNNNRGSRVVSLDLPGLWPVSAEQRVVLAGFRSEMNGPWIAKRVEVSLSKGQGLRTRIDFEDPDAAPKLKKAERNKGGVSEKGEILGTSPEMSAAIKEAAAELTGN